MGYDFTAKIVDCTHLTFSFANASQVINFQLFVVIVVLIGAK
jgi:hypothetical protein